MTSIPFAIRPSVGEIGKKPGPMTLFELGYSRARPFLSPLHGQVRRILLDVASRSSNPRILDVGGRNSPYTIGVPAEIVITDLPRREILQERMHLGLTEGLAKRVLARRSNVKALVFDDMTESALRDHAFDCVVAVEVLEHVTQDENFLDEVRRVLRAGGTFVMTTPNGHAVGLRNPDHKRHYRRQQLMDLLSARFSDVRIDFAIRDGRFHRWGMWWSWSPRHPLQTAASMIGNFINSIQSARPEVAMSMERTRHLVATARKPLN